MPKPIDPLALNPGDLKYPITIQALPSVQTQDSFGQAVPAWATVRSTLADIDKATDSEVLQSGALSSQQVYMMSIYWTPTVISPGMQIVSGADIFHIQAVEDVKKRHRVIRLTCLEVK